MQVKRMIIFEFNFVFLDYLKFVKKVLNLNYNNKSSI